jgi:hypothetical protein
MSDFIPQFRPRKPKKFTEQQWLDPNEPQVILCQGMRGAGKGVLVDYIAEQLYKEGITILHIWGARSFENLYWIVNKNCGEKYQKIREILEHYFINKLPTKPAFCDEFLPVMIREGMVSVSHENGKEFLHLEQVGKDFLDGELLHCKCYKSFPIIWVVPNYIKVDQKSLDEFNHVYWESWEEYHQAYLKNQISKYIPQWEWDDSSKIKKPDSFLEKIPIVVRQITPPTTAHRKETFQKEFTDIVLEARKNRRIVVMNPAIFEGQIDKFDTLAEIFRMIPYLMNKSGHFTPLTEKDVGKSRDYWSKKQQSWHKLAIVINELRSVAPSSKMHGEKSASSSKKAIFDYIPEARHYKTWFVGDYQNPEDLYSGVRHQANTVLIKRASRNILGSDWTWLFDKIENDRMGLCRKKGLEIERKEDMWFYEKNPAMKNYLDERRPRLDELPDNLGYVTFPNNEIKRIKIPLPSFHHKTSLEDFQSDTGITWSVDRTIKSQDPVNLTKSEKTSVSKEKKAVRQMVFEKIVIFRDKDNKNWLQIKDELSLMEKAGEIPDMGFSQKTPKQINDAFLQWKKKQKSQSIPA